MINNDIYQFNYDRNFGVELEFSQKSNREFLYWVISNACPNDKVKITSWQKNKDNIEWVCKTDSSCGFEVSSPVLQTEQDLDKLIHVISELKKNGAHMTRKCGLHVHVECKDLNIYSISKIVSFWIKSEPIIISMFPNYRKINKYCRPISNDIELILKNKYKPSELSKIVSKGKNRTLNIRNYKKRGTIEFRLMEGNLRSKDIYNWIIFCLHFVKCSRLQKSPENLKYMKLNNFMQMLGFDKSEDSSELYSCKKWVIKRLNKFSHYNQYKIVI